MPRSLRVHVNRSGHQEVDARTKRFAADGPFVVELRNQGEGCHVHVSVDGELAIGAAMHDDNPYIPADETLEVPVDVTTDLRPATGTVTVTTGYGRNEAAVDVRVTEDAGGEGADVGGESAEASSRSAASAGDRRAGSSSDGVLRGLLASSLARVAAIGAAVRNSASTGSRSDPATSVAGRSEAAGPGGAGSEASGAAPAGSTGTGSAATGSDDDGESRTGRSLGERLRPPSPEELGPGSLVVAALAVLAVFAAFVAYAVAGSPVVTIAVVLVVLTVVGSGLYLLTY